MITSHVRSLCLFLVVGLSGFAVVGCRRTATLPVIAVIPQAAPEELWEDEREGALLAAGKDAAQIYWNAADREDDVQRQVALVDQVVDGDYAGLVLAPAQELALMVPVRRALRHGLPVVVVGSPLTIAASAHLVYVLNDEAQAGAFAAVSAGRLLHGRGRVAVLGIDPTRADVMARMRAFELDLHREFPKITVTSRKLGTFDSLWSEQVADEVLAARPRADALLTLNVPATFGAYRAELSVPRRLRPKIIACDQEGPLFTLLQNGSIQVLIAQDTFAMGYQAVDDIMRMRRGEPVPERSRIKPILITTANVHDPAVLAHLALLPGALP